MVKRDAIAIDSTQKQGNPTGALLADIHVGVLWATGLLFVCTGAVKAFDMPAFVRAVEGYDLLPSVATVPVAMAIPLLEIAAGLASLWPQTRCWGMAALIVLSLVFSIAIGSALMRGLQVGCGCGLPGALSQVSGVHLGLTLGIALFLTLTLLWPRFRRQCCLATKQ